MSRANCNKIIMLFTDGGEERAQAILEKYNADKKVTSRTRDLSVSHMQMSRFYLHRAAFWFEGFLSDSAFQSPLWVLDLLQNLKIQTGSRRKILETYLHRNTSTHTLDNTEHKFYLAEWVFPGQDLYLLCGTAQLRQRSHPVDGLLQQRCVRDMNTHLRPDCYTSRFSRRVLPFLRSLKCGTCIDVAYSCGSVLVSSAA